MPAALLDFKNWARPWLHQRRLAHWTRMIHWSRWPVNSDLHHRCYIHLKMIWLTTQLASIKILHMWYTERRLMASSCFFFCDLPLGHAVHAPHGSAVAVDAAVWWRINSWWGRSAWRWANSFQFHVAGLRVFFSHSRSSELYVTVWILVHLRHTTNTGLYRFVVLSSGILGMLLDDVI